MTGCRRPTEKKAEVDLPPPARPPIELPDHFPAALPLGDLVGAAACRDCHREAYDAWARSPHGRSMSHAAPDTVLGKFEGTVALPDGTVTLSHDAAGHYMDLKSGRSEERRKVDLVLASGRQHQLYAVRSPQGATNLLPLIWSTRTREWLPTSLYQPGDLDPGSKNYWAAYDMTRGCFSCHLSQMHRRPGPDGPETAWVDLSVNCESCHGPGREHVRRRREGSTDEVYPKLADIGSVQESRVCGPCHGFQVKPYVFPPAEDGFPRIFVTSLINQSLRPDGTQRLTSYQYPAHVLSGGFRLEKLRCKDCHTPHGLTARNTLGESAEGVHSNRQCTSCHPKMVDDKVVTRHSHHTTKVRCVDCHMPYSWIGDDDRRHQRTSDHSISVPRPKETIELGTPNACNTCHTKRSPEWALRALEKWGDSTATGVREWVQTIALARKMAPGASEGLVRLLLDHESGTYLKASALDLLVVQPPDAALVPVLSPFASDPDPNLRAIAIRALDTHDREGKMKWRALGLADSEPYVRMETFSLFKDKEAELLPQPAIDRELEDTLAYRSPPTPGLVHLVTVLHRRHDPRAALEILDLVPRVAPASERRELNLELVRGRLEREIASPK
jgi:hypothetical protein